jgi:hypothetical protein
MLVLMPLAEVRFIALSATGLAMMPATQFAAHNSQTHIANQQKNFFAKRHRLIPIGHVLLDRSIARLVCHNASPKKRESHESSRIIFLFVVIRVIRGFKFYPIASLITRT